MSISWDEAVTKPAAEEAPPMDARGLISWDQVYPTVERPSIIESLTSTFGTELKGLPEEKPKPVEAAEYETARFADTPGGAASGRTLPGWRRPEEPAVQTTPLQSAARVVGAGLQVADMVTGTAKQILGIFPYVATNWYATATGEKPEIAAQAAAESKNYFFPPSISSPWAKVAEAIGPEATKAYHDNPVGWVMTAIGHVAEKGVGRMSEASGSPPEHFQTLLDLTMGWLMKRPIEKGIKERLAKSGATRAAEAPETKAFTDDGVPLENPDPTRYKPAYDAEGKLERWEDFSKPLTDKEVGAISSKEVKAIFERAKKGEDLAAGDVQTVKDFFEAAKKRGQTGEIDPNVIKALAAGAGAATLGIGGYELYREWQRHKQQIEQLELENKSWRNLEEKRQKEEQKRMKPDQELAPKKPFVTAEAVTGMTAAFGPALAGVIRFKGSGVWSESAKLHLGRSLKSGMNIEEPAVKAEQLPLAQRADKMVTDYLNRHAGTETDPLRDLKIPVGDEMVRWEDVTDKAFEAARIPERLELIKQGKAEMGEPIWSLGRDTSMAAAESYVSSLRSYISHMGDYARLNVPPEKLGQYDFVRLAQETAKNDARVAKEMEKARVASSKELPTVKEYPDGQRWVEIKAPEKLTVEQEKRVRKTTEEDLGLRKGQGVQRLEQGEYTALDAQGKPIRNNYTQEVATSSTPEAAFLAGRLAEEGNVMGHCVGGYVDEVFSGQSRIFSLRDAKGESHVTVEVAPGGLARGPARNAPGTSDILQIKGKQNRAPDAKYLPAVQDFVKTQGPWGEVGDLQNTGLTRFRGKLLDEAEYTAALEEINAKDSGAIVDASGLPVRSVLNFRRGQRGASTPEHLVALAGGGVGALIGMQDSDHPIRSGIYGALAGLALGHPAGRQALKTIIKSPDVALGAISTRLGNMHPALKLMERRHELNILRQIDQLNDQVLPFVQAFSKLPKEQQLAAGRMLMNGQEPMLQAIPELAPTLPKMRKALMDVESQLKGLGRFKEGLSGYFPRLVSDLEGLKKALGAEYAIGIEKALVNAEAESVRKAGRGLTDVEQSLVVNRYLHAADQTSFQPGYAKGRKVGEVTAELQPFYEPPVETLLRYLSGAVSDIQTAKFFGRDLKVNKKGLKVSNDVDGSIGNLTSRLITEGKISREQGLELRDILKARFEGGDKGMSQGLAAARNLTNTALLGNIASAATQVGDSLTSIYHQGTVPITQALAQKLIGRQRITPKQLGLINHVAEELSEMGITGRALHNTMKYSGFHAIDMFAKGLLLNASLIKNTKLAQTPKGTAKLIERYGEAFGDEMPQLLEDLRAKRMSQNVETLAFSELSDAQPVSKAEMPEAYLRHPNGRILYQLKTYMLKQTDVVRRDVYQNIASGNSKRIMIGAKNLAALGAVYALANVPGDVIKDILAGRDIDPFTTPKLVENVLQTFGLNRYMQEKLTRGEVVETAQGVVTPPVRVFQDIAQTLHSAGETAPDWKGASYIPLLGRPAYERWLGGNERREISEKRIENMNLPKSERQTLSPAAKEYLRLKRLAAKERKLRREQ